MSQLGAQKAQLTNAVNTLRRKIAEVDQANLDFADFASEASKDPHLIFDRLNLLFTSLSSVSRAASALRGQLEKAEEFARRNPDERGEFPFLSDIHTHWETGGMDDILEEVDALLVRLDSAIKHLSNLGRPYQCFVPSVAPSLSRSSLSHTVQDLILPHQPAQAEEVAGPHSPSQAQDRPADPIAGALTGVPSRAVMTRNPRVDLALPRSSTFSPPNPVSPLEQPVKPPSYGIPIFNGDIEAFSEFWDIFSTAVHDSNTVSAAVKFMYLKSVLKGDAARIIAGLKATAENYDTAVRTLVDTYDRPEILKSRLWDKLIHQPQALDSADSQRATLRALQETWYQMKKVNENSSSIATLKTIRSKFPWRTREKVGELKDEGDTSWTVDELLTTLGTIIDRLQVEEESDLASHRAYNSNSTVCQPSPFPHRYPSTSQPYVRAPACKYCGRLHHPALRHHQRPIRRTRLRNSISAFLHPGASYSRK
ncbi:unnamed protein product [Cylicocyclus nassatus]|uniref:Uncharacterized protein n=1 Tax=Cylicocyclus nassatus TaxID=53992 RepID=A0AA36DTA2_CYLNA|nr:unnamed protein product [Cylicocyclus nassatus]